MTQERISLVSTEDLAPDEETAAPSARAYLFVVLHGDRPALGGARYCLSDLDVVDVGRGAARRASRFHEGGSRRLDLRLPGSAVSKTHARLTRLGDTWTVEDCGSRNGVFRNGDRVTRAVLRDGDFIDIGRVVLRFRAARSSPCGFEGDLDVEHYAPKAQGFFSLLPALAAQLDDLARIAAMPVTVLLRGESGTGKEVLATGIHALSGRPGPFVAVNCGGLPLSLLESQLFGHLKGSFTGAVRDEPGYIRQAERGTLFLDEIGDLPLSAQAALLRALQEREVVPVGGTRPVKVDLRVVAATHKPLDEMVVGGEFRGDLLARLSGYQYTSASLRDRMEDLGILIPELLRRSEVPGARDLAFSVQAVRSLLSHRWPMNIRELSQVLSVAAALVEGQVIERLHLPEEGSRAPAPPREDERPTPDDLRGRIVSLLEKHHGNVSTVARTMGKTRMQIHRWMHKLSINPADYRS